MSTILFKNICKTYDGKNFVLKDLTFSIKDNEFVVLIGASGSGKTTILNLIAGLEDITSGEMFIDDVLSNDIDPKDRDLAMIFQNYALYPHMSVYDNIAFSLRNKKFKENEINKRILEVSKKLNIEELLFRKPMQLSGGQKQRVAIGRAIARKPKIFLMDEPLSNLDCSLRIKMREELKQLYNELNSTIVYVTHDQTEALTLATKIIVLNEGNIEQIGTPLEIFKTPKNEFVAQFIGTPKMNILPKIRIYSNNDKKCIEVFGQKIIFNKQYKNKDIDIGIRPEDFVVSNIKEKGLGVKINFSELIGSECIIHGIIEIDKKEYEIVFKTPVKKKINSKMYIKPKINKIYYFDSKTKERINYEKIC